MRRKIIFISTLFFFINAIITYAQNDEDWQAVSMKVNDVTGVYQWTINWDISFCYTKFDKVLPDGNSVFIDRQIDKNSFLPSRSLVTRDWPGINEIPNGANVSMASMPLSKLFPGSGGELFQENDGKTAHQRDWDALVAVREKIFKENNVTKDTPLWEKVKLIANWAQWVHYGGAVYESKHPVDLIFHSSFCGGRASGFVGIMHTMGLPARTINMNTHTVAEVLLDNKWYYVENIHENKTDTRKTAALMPCSFMEFYADPGEYSEYTSESHINSGYFKYEDLHNERANWQLGALWRWHFIQCGKGDDVMMRHTLKNGSGIAASLNSATSNALYPNAEKYYYKVLKNNPPVLTNYQKHSWYIAGHRVLQGDWIRKRFYIGNLNDAGNLVTKVTSRLYLMGGETQTFAIPPVIIKEYAEWTLKVNDKVYQLKDWQGWELVKKLDPLTMLPVIYFEFQLDKKDLKQNDYNTLQFGSKHGRKFYEQHLYVMIFPDPIKPYINPYKPNKNTRVQQEWRIITDQKWDLMELVEFAR
ncbi:MAG: transglutaminase domain-containing protein [Bacteroidetes bacterium]|nr:transglutaminase domain-containing protein [Bacteroidota bacterium]